MSFNQSRSDKSDNQYRKSGRSGSFNQQRGSSGTYVKGGGGGPAPSPAITSGSLQSSNRSFKRPNNPHGGQSRVNPPPVYSPESNGASSGQTIPNGGHIQQSHGASDAPYTNATAKSSEPSSVQKSIRVVSKAPTPRPTPVNSDTAAPTTPAKAPEDSSRPFAFQFGSISPGFMNGISIPARTSSAPPNLDEQKRDQARHDSYRPVPSVPTPPKQLPPRNDGGVIDQSNAGEAHSVSKVKKEEQLLALAPSSQVQKPSAAVTGISMAMPYHHQSQAPVQFGGPSPQIQSQGMPAASLQMPIPMGNVPQVQQQVFVPGLQHLPIHPHGNMHQGQNLSFTPQMGPQMPHQLGNMGINMNPQYSQQQGGKFAGPRKTTTVKITHPETHEELRLDFDKKADSHSDGMTSGARSYPNVPSQSQPVQSFAASHPLNYFPSSTYSSSSLFFPPSSPLTSSHITPNSQQPRFSYPVNHGHQNAGFNNQLSIGSLPVNKNGTSVPSLGEAPNLEHSRDVQKVISSGTSGVTHASIKPSGGSGIMDLTITNSGNSVVKTSESPSYLGSFIDLGSTVAHKGSDKFSETSAQQSKSSSDSFVSRSVPKQPAAVSAEKLASTPLMPSSAAVSENSVSAVSNNETRRKESLSRSNSLKDNQKKIGKRGQAQHQVPVQSPAVFNVPSQAIDSVMPDRGVSDTVENKTMACVAITSEDYSSTPKALSAPVSSDIVPIANKMNFEPSVEGSVCISAEGVGALAVGSLDNHEHDKLEESSQQDKLSKLNILEVVDKNERSSEVFKQKSDDIATKFEQTEQDVAKVSQDVQQRLESQDESTNCRSECNKKDDNLGVPASNDLDSRDISLNRNDSTVSNESISASSAASDKNSSDLPETASKHSKDCPENAESGSVSLPTSVNKDRLILEPNKVKTTTKGKRNRREIYRKADAAGSTSDLYIAYKRPEEKKEIVVSTRESKESTSLGSLEQLSNEAPQADALATEKDGRDKSEPDDWEDAADMSSPKLEVLGKTQQVSDRSELTAKKYSRDFLLKFGEQCVDLPEGFEIAEDVAGALMNSNISGSHVEHDSHLSPGRLMDRSGGMPRMDRRGSGHFEDDRWNKVPGPMRLDGFGGNAGFRHGQGGNSGVLRNPRGQTHLQYAGGILSGPMQSMGNQGVMQKNSPDGERWQRLTNFQQRGLIPSPQTPLQVMHKAEKKYEVGKVTDEEQAKQRQLKAILNKLTPQNFEKLFEQVKAVNIDNTVTLTGVISQIFEKALVEPTFCEMYADFCLHLAAELPDFSEDNKKITFKRLLLNKCQEEFERGEREQEEANKDDEGEVKQTDEEREEKRVKARRRMLGNIRLIGELYKKKMLTERIMHECIKKLLGSYQDPDEEDIEALCKLMSTIGEMIDHPKAKEHMDAYFERMKLLSNNMNLSSRVRFMLKDAIDLRKNRWQLKRKVEGPKKIEEVHRDAAQERQAQTGRLGRGPGNSASSRRMPMDFSPRVSSMLSPPNTPMGLRGLSAQVRGGGSQDVRQDDRLSYEGRNLSIPLPQRPLGDDSITLGPQGGLARGMSFRGPAVIPSSPVPDVLPGADSRRVASGPNGYSNSSERTLYSSRDQMPRYATDRFAGPTAHDQSAVQERNIDHGNRELRNAERSLERSFATSPSGVQRSALSDNAASENVWPEEKLRDLSMAAIKEYYSARDVKEVALCVKDLNSPSYHPSMISLWVTDSFERKDTERDLLAKLLVSLTKSQDGTWSQAQLILGFESVLSGLEDAVNDAPRAPEFLGQIFARVVTENIVSLKDIGQLLHEGGEKPGQLLEIGLAADVLGSTLEAVKMGKGDAVLSEIRANSNLRLDTFRPPNPILSRKLEKFI